ncbi:MAG: acyl carrier protein [Gammaproteobacteria bacterium]
MQHSTVVDELIGLLNKALPEPRALSVSSEIVGDVGLESIQVIEYLCEVEDRYDLIIDEDSLADVKTIGDLADVVVRLKSGD